MVGNLFFVTKHGVNEKCVFRSKAASEVALNTEKEKLEEKLRSTDKMKVCNKDSMNIATSNCHHMAVIFSFKGMDLNSCFVIGVFLPRAVAYFLYIELSRSGVQST